MLTVAGWFCTLLGATPDPAVPTASALEYVCWWQHTPEHLLACCALLPGSTRKETGPIPGQVPLLGCSVLTLGKGREASREDGASWLMASACPLALFLTL